MSKKSTYKVIAEAIGFDGLKGLKVSTARADRRKLTIDEIKEYILEEFGNVKAADAEEVQEPEKGWMDAELAKSIEWAKAVDLIEIFNVKRKGK